MFSFAFQDTEKYIQQHSVDQGWESVAWEVQNEIPLSRIRNSAVLQVFFQVKLHEFRILRRCPDLTIAFFPLSFSLRSFSGSWWFWLLLTGVACSCAVG